VVVKGFPDVLPIYLAVVVLLVANPNRMVELIVVLLGAVAVASLSALEYNRYARVAKAAAAAWTRRDQRIRRAYEKFA
jgi:hypothetical protein